MKLARATFADPFVPGGGFEDANFLQTADGFRLPEYDITLAFYNLVSGEQVVGRALRYLRRRRGLHPRHWMLMRIQTV